MAFYNDFPEYVSVAERKRRAAEAAEKLKKKKPALSPIVIAGRSIAKNWWGKAWCDNLESYADYANRIERGRSYVRHGAVLDLQISQGKVEALVQGSSSKPYKVELAIPALNAAIWDNIVKECTGQIDSLQQLAAGKFPAALSGLFTTKGKGLFPSPKEIKLSCSCPDYAIMCKHVAAVLYGVGARLDENYSLLFELREVQLEQLIKESIAKKSESLLGQPDAGRTRRRRAMEETDLASAFGIELDAAAASESSEGEGSTGRRGRGASGRTKRSGATEAKGAEAGGGGATGAAGAAEAAGGGGATGVAGATGASGAAGAAGAAAAGSSVARAEATPAGTDSNGAPAKRPRGRPRKQK